MCIFQVFLKLQGIPEDDKISFLEQCADGEMTVEEMGELATELKRSKMVEEHVVKHFKGSCKTIDEVYQKHGDKITEEKLKEFVQGMFVYQG